jgi:outer membrane receptor for ferrienterochelin and colicins
VVPGARLTWNEQWGSQLTPRLALRWRATDAMTVRASAGQGFRAPDFKELYLQFTNDGAGYAVYGNADLRPEHSDNFTAGVEWSGGRTYARGQLFWNRLRDFIETRPLPSTGSLVLYEYGNVDEGLTQGADVEAGVVLGALRLEGGYGFLSAEDRRTGQALLGRPEHSGRATATYALPFGLRGSLAGVYTGETPMQRAEDGVITSTRDAFLRLDVRLAQRLPQGLEVVVGADNLFDRVPAQWAGAVGRQIYTGVSWSFAREND